MPKDMLFISGPTRIGKTTALFNVILEFIENEEVPKDIDNGVFCDAHKVGKDDLI